MEEAEIIVDGKKLTVGESMAVRVAICSFLEDLKANGLGDDEMGKSITKGYIDNCNQILFKMKMFNQGF